MKHPVKAASDERAAIIAHIERKAAAAAALADSGRTPRSVAEDVRRVLFELTGDLKNGFHLEDLSDA